MFKSRLSTKVEKHSSSSSTKTKKQQVVPPMLPVVCLIGLIILLISSVVPTTNAFTSIVTNRNHKMSNPVAGPLFVTTKSKKGGPRPLHTEFTVEKATPELLEELDVMNWPTWSTDGSPKYKVGIKSPLKVYDCNELSYVTDGEVDIIHAPTGKVSTVRKGDFVTFPDGYECYWYVKETITKNWYIY
jgi:hypothetical protein